MDRGFSVCFVGNVIEIIVVFFDWYMRARWIFIFLLFGSNLVGISEENKNKESFIASVFD